MTEPARFAWLVLAHADPEQLCALLDRLAPAGGPDFAVVHIDRKSALWRQTRGRFLTGRPNVTVVPRPAAVRWGHRSQVTAAHRALEAALRLPFTHAHLVSGADWPLVTRGALVEALSTCSARDCFIEAAPGVQPERMDRIRLDARWLRPDPARWWQWYPARALRRLSRWIPRRAAGPWGPWHTGSQWWTLPRDVCEALPPELDRAVAGGHLFGTVCADEHLIQTIVARQFPQRLAHSNRRFIAWDGGPSPRTLTAPDWPAAQASGAWIARKLSRDADPFFLALPLPPAQQSLAHRGAEA